MPLRFVLPSAASVNIVSISDSNSSAGLTSQRKRASVSPAFQKRCGVPGSTVTTSPGPATIFSPPDLEADLAVEHLEALGLMRMNVRRRDAAVGAHDRLDEHGLAVRLLRGLVEDENLAGDGVLEAVSLANHVAVLSSVSEWLVDARTA